MHHGYGQYWRAARAAASCGPAQQSNEGRWENDMSHDHDGGAGFGVRRPLRFMAHKLDLNEAQVAELAKILDDLKTERAQAAVDQRRSVAAFADALAGEAFDAKGAKTAGDLRVTSAERLRDAVLGALARTHAMLDPEQRKQLAYLMRSGALTI
jgi:Spy/CpxP family protein refolding chaperone